jgi:hypothetical protein
MAINSATYGSVMLPASAMELLPLSATSRWHRNCYFAQRIIHTGGVLEPVIK